MAEFKEQHAKVTGMQNAVASGNLKSLIGGEEPSDSNAVTQSPKTPSSTKARGNNKNKRR